MASQPSSRLVIPVSKRVFWARLLVVLAIDAALVAGGIAFFAKYQEKRAAAALGPAPPKLAQAGSAEDEASSSPVELPKPKVIRRGKKRVPTTPTVVPSQTANPTTTTTTTTTTSPTPSPFTLSEGPAEQALSRRADAAPAVVPPAGLDAAPVAAAPTPDAAGDPEEDARAERIAEVIRDTMKEGRVQIDKCYERAARATTRADPLRGTIEVNLTILASGDTSDVRVVENDTGSDELGGCLTALLRSWQFPSPGTESIEFLWPFVFKGR